MAQGDTIMRFKDQRQHLKKVKKAERDAVREQKKAERKAMVYGENTL